MNALLRTIASCHFLALALAGCSTVATTTPVTLEWSIPINSEYAFSSTGLTGLGRIENRNPIEEFRLVRLGNGG